MGDLKKNYRFALYVLLVMAATVSAVPAASAWDFSGNPISTNTDVNINTVNGGGYLISFNGAGGGLNALHITTSTSEPSGQVSTVSSDSGTFYLADTGGRGYFDKAILMVAIRAPGQGEELSDDLKINIRASGYRWASSGIENRPPYAGDIVYVRNSIDRDFGLSSVTYGPQSWKPAGEADHPVMYDQSSSDEFYLFFVDTGVGVLGEYSQIGGLADNGMARIDYSIENYDGETIVFNVYGYALSASAVQNGIAWTNKIEGTTTDKNSGTSPSGYAIFLGSGSAGGEFSPGAIDYGDGSWNSYSGSDRWIPSVGNLNITSEPVGAKVYIDGVDSGRITNASFVDIPAGEYRVGLRLQDYDPVESDDIHVKAGYVTTRHFNLTPASGRCTVLSDVRGARIFIDGEETLCYANWTFPDIIAGDHTVSIKTSEGRVFSEKISVSPENEAIVFFKFSPADQHISEDASPGVKDFEGASLSYSAGKDPGSEKISAEGSLNDNAGIPGDRTGSIYITSNPSKMSIFIDGADSGYVTPQLICGLKEGYHKVEVKKEKILPESKRIYTPAGETVVAHFNLVDADDVIVGISVESRDLRDGSFAVNGELPYINIPSDARAGSFGSYLTYNDGENYYSKPLPVLSGGESFILKKAGRTGSLSIASDPCDADIYVDGLKTGYRTPYIMDNIGEGYHRLKVVKDGCLPEEKEIFFVSEGKAVDSYQYFILEEIPTGNLTVTSNPGGCKIYLRGDYTGQTTPCTFENLPIGTYDVGIMLNRTVFKDKEVTVLEYEKFGDTNVDFYLG